MALSQIALATGLLVFGWQLALAADAPVGATDAIVPDCWIEHAQIQEPPKHPRPITKTGGLAPGAFLPRRYLGAEHPRPEQMRPCRFRAEPAAQGIRAPDFSTPLSLPERP